MENKANQNKPSTRRPKTKIKWLIIFIAIFFIFFAAANFVALAYEVAYSGRIYPGVIVSNLNLGGKTQDQARQILEKNADEFIKNGLIFKAESSTNAKSKEINIFALTSSTDPDLARQIFRFNLNKTLSEAYQYGRHNFLFRNLFEQARIFLFGKRFYFSYEINETELLDILKTNFKELENPADDAKLAFGQNDKISILPEQQGQILNFIKALSDAKSTIASLDNEPIVIEIIIEKPNILSSDAAPALALATQLFSTSSPVLFYKNKNWQITKDELKSWIQFKKINKNEIGLEFSTASTTEFLESIASEIDIEPQDAKFRLNGSRVSEFQSSREGKKLNLEKTIEKLNYQYFHEGVNSIELVIEITPPKIKTADVNNLGIKELIGRGVSNFKGSPPNRRHNIKTGAAALNGILIEPGEEFSLLKALGEISAQTGYLPELVIKGDRTIPEYGGGLCQIGTTTFRAALRSGLPITARTNHSYRVVYYEPAGMDATIYDPRPDMKFLNDTGAYILFTAKIEGDELIFEFYGTKDGRSIEITPDPPAIYNITSPGKPREIETEELPPGERKLVEHAHNGADTYFDYIVTYPDGTVKKERFSSHYVAWPEVWLVGKALATTTEEIINEQSSTAL